MTAYNDIDQLSINVIRGLSMDMPQRANSGHPGTAMALAPLAHVLFTRVMRHHPEDSQWFDRDRFILSCGHASPLIYSALHLSGYDVTVDDLQEFRQWGSRTPGHPEYRHTHGVEVTTGPLGQGFANGVGAGIAEAWMRGRFGEEISNHHTFVLCSDGDLQEGVTHEAGSLAGHLGLGRLIYVYDDNHISIDGPTELSFTDDSAKRFESYGWDVRDIGEAANDPEQLEAAIREAMTVEDKPSLIVLRSHIGWPSPNFTDTAKAHGEPLGEEEVARTKEILGLPSDKSFYVPEEVRDLYKEKLTPNRELISSWNQRYENYSGEKDALDACLRGGGMSGWETKLPRWNAGESVATRVAINDCINATSDVVPGVVGGGADLTGNTGTKLSGTSQFSGNDPAGRQIFFGIREHGMGSIMNGMAYHGGVIPIGGTFFVFSDYMRGAVRLAALSQIHSVFIWSHDSVGLGEDGPTHQPIEHLASLRAMPGLAVLRPADANETAHAWQYAVNCKKPVALILSRQKLPTLETTADRSDDFQKGAYVLVPADSAAVLIVATGSEVAVAVGAANELKAEGIAASVVSMPSWELFEEQDERYKSSVFPPNVPVLSVEAASSFGWARYADSSVAIDRFGASAPGDQALAEFGFTPEKVAAQARNLIAAKGK